jgi:hypothetical protein
MKEAEAAVEDLLQGPPDRVVSNSGSCVIIPNVLVIRDRKVFASQEQVLSVLPGTHGDGEKADSLSCERMRPPEISVHGGEDVTRNSKNHCTPLRQVEAA